MAESLKGMLQAQGKLIFEMGINQHVRIENIFKSHDWVIDSIIKDLQKIDRVMIVSKS